MAGAVSTAVSPNVLIVSLATPPEPFLLQTIRGLQLAGVEPHVCLSARPGQPIGDWDFPTTVLPSWNVSWAARALTLARLLLSKSLANPGDAARIVSRVVSGPKTSGGIGGKLQKLYRLLPLAGQHPDVVHFQWNTAAVDYEELHGLLRCPVIVSCRGSQVNVAPYNPRRQLISEDLRRTLARAAVVHCVSDAMASAVRALGVEPAKIAVIRPAVDTDFFTPVKHRERSGTLPLHIVMTGSLLWIKGHEYALLALRRLLDAGVDATLTIVGDGPGRQQVLFTIADLDLDHAVSLKGSQGREGVREALHAADVFLLSSVSEGLSNAVLEAMACGLPVVTTDCGGMSEAVTHDVQGLLVPVRDADLMAAALRRLALDEGLRTRMGEAARETAVDRFAIASQAERFKDVYTSAMRARAPREAPAAARAVSSS